MGKLTRNARCCHKLEPWPVGKGLTRNLLATMLSSDSERNELSRREDEVLRLASNGFTDRQIAATLGIKVSTVTTYWIRIRSKIGQLNRSELVAYAVRQKSEGIIAGLRMEVGDLKRQVSQLREELDVAWRTCDLVTLGITVHRPDGSVAFTNLEGSEPPALTTEIVEKETGHWKVSHTGGPTRPTPRSLL